MILIVCFAQIDLKSQIMRLFNKSLLVSKNCCCIYRRKSFVQEKIQGCSGGLASCVGSSFVPWLFLLGSSKTLQLMKKPSRAIRKKLSLHKFGPWHLIFYFFFLTKGMSSCTQVNLSYAQTGASTKPKSLFKHLLGKQDDTYIPEAALVASWLDDDFCRSQMTSLLQCVFYCFALLCLFCRRKLRCVRAGEDQSSCPGILLFCCPSLCLGDRLANRGSFKSCCMDYAFMEL